MKNKIVFYIFLFFIILSPAFSDLVPSNDNTDNEYEIDNIAPPEWILGTWIVDEETDDPFIIEFTKTDILMDNYSLIEDIETGYVIGFSQTVTEEYYEMYVKFENDEWYQERFFIISNDVMESQFTASDGTELSFTYSR
ncbi:MAG: hypothetical protein FWF38_02820 [Spirochaetaceae bacterium]|nr:hypothetical protein [Spirochaetaceae bacterium]